MKEIVNLLKKTNKTISTMESCTGGSIVNEITNIEGASDILKFSAITYSNEYKIKMGVSKDIIDKYSVYSIETANEMSKAISNYTNSDYGIGITGKLNRIDKNNPFGEDNIVYISIYIKETNEYITKKVQVENLSRKANKELIIKEVKSMLLNLIKYYSNKNK